MQALEAVRRWPVRSVVAGVVTASGERHTAGTVSLEQAFPLASVTKLLTAYAVLVAVEEGTVALDQTVGPPAPPTATVRHLLAHASGLAPDPPPTTMAPPGRRRIYSNAGFELLADVVAARAGMPFATYLHEAVLDPLGLTGTRLEGSPAVGAVSALPDLLTFAAELLAPALVHATTLEGRETRPAFPGLAGVLPGFGRQDPNDWGLGFELRDAKHPHWTGSRNSPATFGHFGRSGTFLWVDPTVGVATVVLTDETFGPWAAEAWPALSDAVLAELT